MDFKEFLDKYSFIDRKFLDDFYDIIKEDYIERYYDFLIDSEILREWLDINNRRDFNDTIKRSYRKNIDYKIETKKVTNGSGGHNFQVITLTPEAAKKICLSTNSKMGPKVQQYFLDLEFILYKYKNYIIDGMDRKIKQLENNQKPKINSDKKIIYVFQVLNTDLTLYKLGKTINQRTRFDSYNSGLANDIKLLFQYETENIDQVEACVKSKIKLAKYRKYKEVYEISLKLLKQVIKECDGEIQKVNKSIIKEQKGKGYTIEDDSLYMFIPNEAYTKK